MKWIRIFLLSLLCLGALTLNALGADFHVDTMEVSLVVDKNGTAKAEADLQVRKEDGGNRFSLTLGPDVSGVHLSGFEARVHRNEGQTLLTIDGENGLPDEMDLHLSYTIRNTVESSGDTQDFSVRLLGGTKDADIGKLSVKVQMPAPFAALPSFNSGYYADGIDNYLDIRVTEEGLLTASSTEPLLAGETLDLALEMEAEYFTLYNVAGRTLLLDRIAMIVLALFGALYWWRSLRSPLMGSSAQHRAPTGVEPGVAAMLITGENPDLSLMVMNWSLNGYLRVIRLRGQRIMLIRQMPMGNERSSYEQEVFSRLFAKRPEVLCGEKSWRSAQKKAKKVARGYWRDRLYEKKPGKPGLLRGLAVLFCGFAVLLYADQTLPSMHLRILCLVLSALAGLGWGAALQSGLKRLPLRRRRGAILCLALCLLLMLVAWRITHSIGPLLLALGFSVLTALVLLFGPKRTAGGAELLAQLLGWRRFLKALKPDDAQQLLASDPQYYYKTLLYAEALCVGRKFSRAFEGLKLDECPFLEQEGKDLPRQAVKFRAAFRHILAIARGEASTGAPASAPQRSRRSAPHSTQRRRNNNPPRRREEVYDPVEV